MTPLGFAPIPLVISLSLVIKFDVESGSDGRLTPEVISPCGPRPPPCEPEITFEESVGDWLAGVAQPRRPQHRERRRGRAHEVARDEHRLARLERLKVSILQRRRDERARQARWPGGGGPPTAALDFGLFDVIFPFWIPTFVFCVSCACALAMSLSAGRIV